MFCDEINGILRSETVGLITTIYDCHTLPDNISEKLHDALKFAVLEDDIEAVKTNALCFWKKVIDKHLAEEGMIDGEFPSVTFSKKLKKIITFDDFVIKQCLDRVLSKLSKLGCLTVFLFALNSDSHKILKQTALDLIMPFIQLLKKHYLSPKNMLSGSLGSSPRSSVTYSSNSTSSSSNIFSPYPESLYEDILDMQETLVSDSSILQMVIDESVMVDSEAVQRDEFVKFVANFDFSLHNRRDSENIEIILNNILG